jgi:NDP-sugar pyrophosphorylase family protein
MAPLMQAYVIAGGRGERLRPHTDDRPKVMVEVEGRPLLSYHLDWLQANGASEAVLLTGYLSEVIENYFGDRTPHGLALRYIAEPEPLGRGGALRFGLESVPPKGDVVIATNGDVITTQSLEPLLRLHRRYPDALATLLLVGMTSPFGIVQLDNENRVLEFEEKPSLPHWINAGVYALSPQILAHLPKIGDHETTTFPQLAKEGRLFAYCGTPFWCSVDNAKDLRELSDVITELPLSVFQQE